MAQCSVDADAGPDQFTCDPSMPPELQGNANGSMFSWNPRTYLSDPNSLNPLVIAPPGRYTYTLTTSGVSTLNLIDNGDFEAGQTGFSSNYNFSNSLLPEGTYNVGPDPSAFHPGFSPCGDHTSGSGNQLIVNGSVNTSNNIWCQTVTLIPGKMYLFSVSAQSVVGANPPLISISFNGVDVGQIAANSVCNWVTFEYCFMASAANVAICLRELTGNAGGNDFTIDDITMFEKCDDKDDVIVEIVDLRAVLDIPVKPKCESEEFVLDGSRSSSGPNIRYEWSTDIGNILNVSGSKAMAKGSGLYKLKIIYDNGTVYCEKEVEVLVDVADDLEGEIIVTGVPNCQMDTVLMTASVFNGSGRYQYSWSSNQHIISGQGSPIIKITQSGWYTVFVTDLESGCIFETQQYVFGDTTLPQAQIRGDSILNCRKNTALLQSKNIDTSKYQITWILPNNNRIDRETSITASLEGIYRVILVDKSTKCADTAQWLIKKDVQQPDLQLQFDSLITCSHDTAWVNILGFENQNVLYNWSVSGNTQPSDTSASWAFVQSSNGTIRKTDLKNGCFSEDSFYIRDVRAIPQFKLKKSGDINCKNESILISSDKSNQRTSKIWSSSSGSVITHLSDSAISVTQGGWYGLTVTDSLTDCSYQDSIFVEYAKFQPQVKLRDSLYFSCGDSVIVVDPLNSTISSSTTFQWSTINGKINSDPKSLKLIAAAPGEYVLITIDTLSLCGDTVKLIIIPDQKIPLVQIDQPLVLNCRNLTIQLQGRVQTQSGAQLIFNWSSSSFPSIKDSMILNPVISVPGKYQLEVIDQSNFCKNSTEVIVLQDTIQPMSQAGVDTIWKCDTKSLILFGLGSQARNIKYSWSTLNGIILGPSDQQSLTVGGAGSYVLRVEDDVNGCFDLDTVTVRLDINFPRVTINIPDTLNCLNKQIELLANNNSGAGNFSYQWSSSNGNIIGNTDSTLALVDKPGYYKFKITNNSNLCIAEDSVLVIENLSQPFVDAGPARVLTCRDSVVQLDGSFQNQNITFAWHTTSGNILSPIDSKSILVDKPGKYYLLVTDQENYCNNVDSVLVTLNTDIPRSVSKMVEDSPCVGLFGSFTLTDVKGGVRPYNITIDGLTTDLNKKVSLSAGNHFLKITDANGCDFEERFSIKDGPIVEVDLLATIQLVQGVNYTLDPVFSVPDSEISSIEWYPASNLSCSYCKNPVVQNLTSDQNYSIRIITKDGCEAEANILIKIVGREIWLPNIFSANGDHINDNFFPVITPSAAAAIEEFAIFDRWGERVFFAKDIDAYTPELGWDGLFKHSQVNPGVYVYYLKVKWKDNTTEQLHGDITVVR